MSTKAPLHSPPAAGPASGAQQVKSNSTTPTPTGKKAHPKLRQAKEIAPGTNGGGRVVGGGRALCFWDIAASVLANFLSPAPGARFGSIWKLGQ